MGSRHIKILNECQLLQQRQEGREINYQVNTQKMKLIDKWLEPFRLIWENRFNKLDKVFTTTKTK